MLRRFQTVPWAIAAFATAAAAVTAHTFLRLNVPGSPGAYGQNGMQDFRDAVYFPVVALAEGRNPYDPAVFSGHYPVASAFPLYSPSLLTLHYPLAYLPIREAEVLYYALNLALVPLLVWLARRGAGLATSRLQLFGWSAAALLSRPVNHDLFLGQPTLYIAIGAYLALVLAKRRPLAAGVALALTGMKPTYALPLAVLMLCRGEVRAVAVAFAITVAASLPPLAMIVRRVGLGGFAASLRENYLVFSDNSMVDPASSIYRVDIAVPAAHLLGGWFNAVTSLLATAAVLVLAALAVRRLERGDAPRPISDALVCLATLLCTYHLTYDALLLYLPIAVVSASLARSAGRERIALVVLLVLLEIPMLNYLAAETPLARLGLAGGARAAAVSVNAVACLASLLLYVALARRRVVGAAPSARQVSFAPTARGERRRAIAS